MTTIRDFLYLDVDRVRSLLAQLEGGVVERSVERLTKSKTARAGGSVFGLLDIGGGLFRERAMEQTKTLQDALFLLFEDAARESGLFDLDVDLSQTESWEDGTIQAGVVPGRLLRVTAETRILDGKHFRERIERFSQWPKLIVGFSAHAELQAIKNPKERERRLNQRVEQAFEGAATSNLTDLGGFVDLFLGGQISMRQFPCGTDHPNFALVGMLLGRPGYLQEEREALFGKYGSAPSEWTVVSQVATVPQEPGHDVELNVGELVTASSHIDRSGFEELAAGIMQMLEVTGIAEGPAFPSIAVTPIAVYREVVSGSRADAAS